MKNIYRIVGVSRKKSITCETSKQDTFHPNLDNLPLDRFNALWDLLEGNWGDKPMCMIEHDGLSNDGMPKNPKFIEVSRI